jgi:hypothetical protein
MAVTSLGSGCPGQATSAHMVLYNKTRTSYNHLTPDIYTWKHSLDKQLAKLLISATHSISISLNLVRDKMKESCSGLSWQRQRCEHTVLVRSYSTTGLLQLFTRQCSYDTK